MAKLPQARLIAVNGASTGQLLAVHNLVVENSGGYWWHQMPHVWIVGGNQPTAWWRDQIAPIINTVGLPPQMTPAVLVVDLPSHGWMRDWAYFGPNDQQQIDWLQSYL
jgi:hypothetical protein